MHKINVKVNQSQKLLEEHQLAGKIYSLFLLLKLDFARELCSFGFFEGVLNRSIRLVCVNLRFLADIGLTIPSKTRLILLELDVSFLPDLFTFAFSFLESVHSPNEQASSNAGNPDSRL